MNHTPIDPDWLRHAEILEIHAAFRRVLDDDGDPERRAIDQRIAEACEAGARSLRLTARGREAT